MKLVSIHNIWPHGSKWNGYYHLNTKIILRVERAIWIPVLRTANMSNTIIRETLYDKAKTGLFGH
jgi:hypothetical protein